MVDSDRKVYKLVQISWPISAQNVGLTISLRSDRATGTLKPGLASFSSDHRSAGMAKLQVQVNFSTSHVEQTAEHSRTL